MRLLKPSWVSHDGKPIFSIDIHPDGSRFATGGQGDNAGRIIIWNMAPIKDEKQEADENIPKMLCQMDNHLACVNCVRWSNNGKYLASGGDDKLAMVWQTSRYACATTVFGSEGKMVNLEQWRCVHTLRGHSGDVLDLAWSPQDLYLATCSIDNNIVVWNARKLPEQLAVLKGHTSLVKGVTWDPVGKYLASQSDDKTLRVWRTLDWQVETSVTGPFEECGGTTHVLRLGWSPDGHYLVSAHAMNNSGPTAQIIERNGWKVAMDFVGHRKAVTVVRFNPNILSKKIKKNAEKPQQYSCCAIGSRDRAISIWLTALKRPLVVTHDLFTNSVMDISWSQTGMALLCCSWDGTVAYLEFTTDEIGTPLTVDEKNQLHKRIYGKSMAMNTSINNTSQIIETTAMLKLHQEKEQKNTVLPVTPGAPSKLVNGTTTNGVPSTITPARVRLDSSESNSSKLCGSPDKQIETKTQDGRRRITPIFLAPQPALGEVPLPFSVPGAPIPPAAGAPPAPATPVGAGAEAGGNAMFTTSTEPSKIVVERQEADSPQAGEKPPERPSFYDTSPIQPMTKMDALEGPTAGKSTTKIDKPALSETSTSLMEKSMDRDKGNMSVKRKLEPDPVTPPPSQPPVKKKDGRGRPRKYPLPDQVRPVQPPPPVQVVEKPPQIIYKASGLELPVPSIDNVVSLQISGSVGSDSALVVEVENNFSPSLHIIRCMQGGKVTWQSILSNKAIAVAGNSYVVCAACNDRSVHLLSSSSGRRMLPPLMLDSCVSTIRCSGNYVMAVSSKGTVFVWNTQSLAAVIKNESLVSIIPDNGVKLVSSLLTEQGLPIMTLSTGNSYTFKVDVGCWVLLSSKSDRLHSGSDHQSCIPSDVQYSSRMGPLATLQSTAQRPGTLAASLFQSNPALQQPVTLSHLENQVACSLAMQSSNEYHFWLLTYVRYLVAQGQEPKLREVCDELLGPMFRSRALPKWQPTVLGHNKRKLLGEILPLIGSNLSLQRLFTEFQEQLEAIKT